LLVLISPNQFFTAVDKFCPHDEACPKASRRRRQGDCDAGPGCEHFNVIEDIRPGQIPVLDTFSDPFFFSELKNDSATALSWQLPRRLMLGARLLARQNRCQSSLPYWLPGPRTPF
jgi:hypothetical protein